MQVETAGQSPEEGDVLVYVCGDCWQRWDIVVDIDDLDDDEDESGR